MKGFYLANEGHVVDVLPPVNVSGGVTGDRFTMRNYGHASIIVKLGVSSNSPPDAIIVKECNAATGGTATAIGFTYYAEETAAGDTLGAKATAATTGIVPSANDNIFYVIEIDAAELTDGYEWIEVSMTNASASSTIADVTAILSGSRFGNDQSATALV